MMLLAIILAGCGSGGGGNNILGEEKKKPGNKATDAVIRIGSGVGGTFKEGRLSAEKNRLFSGTATTITVNVVDKDNKAVSDTHNVIFASECVSKGLAAFDKTEVFTEAGRATVQYTPSGCSGKDEITAKINVKSTHITAKVTVTIEADEVLSVQFVSATPTRLSLKGMGNETAKVTFRLVGAHTAPIIGESVSFSISPVAGGMVIVDGKQTDISDAKGEVSTVVRSGTVANSVQVTAIHDATGITGVSDDITVSTGFPIRNRFSLSVSDFAPQNAFKTDGIEVTLGVMASDQFGNPVSNGKKVSFWAREGGQIPTFCSLINGRCSVKWISSRHTASDNRISIMAFMNGVEAFTDKNGNNIFDAGDDNEFEDVAEPCLDDNENGICEPQAGELFSDTNNNGIPDGPDSVWNGPCLSAVNDAAICNKPESVQISRTVVLALPTNTPQIRDRGTFANATIEVSSDKPKQLKGMVISDSSNPRNPLPTGSKIVFTVEPASVFSIESASVIESHRSGPTGPFGLSIIAKSEKATKGKLTMTIDLPGDVVDDKYSWQLIASPPP